MTHQEWLEDINFRYAGIGNWRKYHWEFISDPDMYDKLINDPAYEIYLMELLVRI
jgi:hypothetical protein